MEMHNLQNIHEWMDAGCAFNGQQSAGRTSIQTFPFLCSLCCTAIHVPFIRHWIHGTNENTHFILGARFSNSLCLHYYNCVQCVRRLRTQRARHTKGKHVLICGLALSITPYRMTNVGRHSMHSASTAWHRKCIGRFGAIDFNRSGRYERKTDGWTMCQQNYFHFISVSVQWEKWQDDGNGNDENMHIPNATMDPSQTKKKEMIAREKAKKKQEQKR